MINQIKKNKESIIRIAFLIPILSVAIISISHVVSWYNLANPISWAIYLSIAVEVAALSSIAAASVKVKGFSVWFVFIIVTLIQFIGNIYFSYTEIDVTSKEFKDWAELTFPIFDSFSDTADIISQRRLLAVLEGGLLPLISLTCLHFFIKYGDRDSEVTPLTIVEPLPENSPTDFEETPISSNEIILDEPISEPTEEKREPSDNLKNTEAQLWKKVRTLKQEGKLPNIHKEDLEKEPTALANSANRLNERPEEKYDSTRENKVNLNKKQPIIGNKLRRQ